MTINIIFPVLNERLRLQKGIETTVQYLQENCQIPYQLSIVDNGSTDETPEIGRKLCEKYDCVRYTQLHERGVGVAFRKGIAENESDIVGYMDIDLSTDIHHLGEAIQIFATRPEIQYINGSRFSRESDTKGRKWYRKITSQGLLVLLHIFLQMKVTDAICGFTFMRKEVAEELVAASSDDNGWFYMIEVLLRAERRNIHILDYPVEWQEDYNTTVKVFKVAVDYLKHICQLFYEFNIRKHI